MQTKGLYYRLVVFTVDDCTFAFYLTIDALLHPVRASILFHLTSIKEKYLRGNI